MPHRVIFERTKYEKQYRRAFPSTKHHGSSLKNSENFFLMLCLQEVISSLNWIFKQYSYCKTILFNGNINSVVGCDFQYIVSVIINFQRPILSTSSMTVNMFLTNLMDLQIVKICFNFNSHGSGNSWKSHQRLFWHRSEYLY